MLCGVFLKMSLTSLYINIIKKLVMDLIQKFEFFAVILEVEIINLKK